MPKRPQIPADTFAKKPSALDKLTGQASTSETPATSDPNKPPALVKSTVYLTPMHLEKLEELAREHRLNTGSRYNRHDVLRRLIERASLRDLI